MPNVLKVPRWTKATEIKPDPDVVLFFHGLMCMCNHKDGFCEVGVLNTDQGKHDLHIYLFELPSEFEPLDLSTYPETWIPLDTFDVSHTGTAYTDIVRFEVVRPRVSGVSFYQPGAPKTADHDFRFIVDLEGPDFYNGMELGKNHAALGPRLHVPDALFYTLFKTSAKFKAQEGTDTPKDIDSVAAVTAANIYLDRTPSQPGKVFLSIDNSGSPVQLPTTPGKKNLVWVDNSCHLPECEDTSDFPRYYDAVKVPLGRKKFNVQKAQDKLAASARHIAFVDVLNRVFAGVDIKPKPFGTDDTPCGIAGAGVSGTLGPQT